MWIAVSADANRLKSVVPSVLASKKLWAAAAIKGWDEAAQKLGEHAGPVIEFLKNFLPQ